MTIFPARKVICPFVGLAVLIVSPLVSAQNSSDVPRPLPPVEVRPPISVVPFVTVNPTGYTPVKMRHAYGFDLVTGTGTGQTIAIVEAYGSSTIQSDLNKFCTTFGLPTTTLSIYYPQGVPAPNTLWALETTLDVQWAHAI